MEDDWSECGKELISVAESCGTGGGEGEFFSVAGGSWRTVSEAMSELGSTKGEGEREKKGLGFWLEVFGGEGVGEDRHLLSEGLGVGSGEAKA